MLGRLQKIWIKDYLDILLYLGKKKSFSHIKNVREAITKLQGKPVLQYSLDGKFLKEWSCGAEAARFYNVDKSSLMRCCQGHFKKSAGFVWKYKE